MKKSNTNPFQITGFNNSHYFCDREKELKELQNHIANGRNVVLYAWRRFGKTVLIKRFFHDVMKKKMVPVYVDLLATASMDDAIESMAKALYQTFENPEKGFTSAIKKLIGALGLKVQFDAMTGMPEIAFSIASPSKTPEQSLEAIGRFLAEQKKLIVIAIDEFQQVTHYKEQKAEALFRGFVQNHPNVRFIFSGSSRSLMLSMFNEQNRPFFMSAQMLPLDAISLDNYRPFIQNHFLDAKKVITAKQIEYIYEWSRGQTYTIQLICNYLFERQKSVTDESITKVCQDIIEQQKPLFAHIQQLLTNGQWNVLKAIAKEGYVNQPLNKLFIQKYHLGATSSVQVVLNALVNKEMIIQTDEGYCLHDVLFSRWLEGV